MRQILIAEADDHTLRARGDELLIDGYGPIAASTSQHTRAQLAHGTPDALILGQLETTTESFLLLRDLRAGKIPRADPRLPVLTIGADTDQVAVRHYQSGADIALPASASPLLIKHGLEALATRATGEHERTRVLRIGSLTVDCDARTATIDQTPLTLSRLEFDLLQTLASHPRRVFTRDRLYKDVWGYDPLTASMSRTVDSTAHRLRKHLKAAGSEPLVQTVWGVGYRLTR